MMAKRGAFTLVELLVVIAILFILLGLLLPAIQSAREAARTTSCRNNLRQLSLAASNYCAAKNRFPKGYFSGPGYPGSGRPEFDPTFGPTPYRSLVQQLLPFLEQQALSDQADEAYRLEWYPFNTQPHKGYSLPLPVLNCPSVTQDPVATLPDAGTVAFTHYLGVNGTNYMSTDGMYCIDIARRPAEITDGLSNTLAFGERPTPPDMHFGWWYCGLGSNGTLLGTNEVNAFLHGNAQCGSGPYKFAAGNDWQCDSLHFWSRHPGGANFSLADGSTTFLSYEISPENFKGLGTIKGREVILID